jgi:hypothetical protein
MLKPACEDRIALTNSIQTAVARSYAARAAYNAALKSRKATVDIEAELDQARKDELAAVIALNQHRNRHGC